MVYRRLQHLASTIEPSTRLLIGLWVLTMISLPIVRWTAGEGALRWGIVLGVIVQVVVVLHILVRAWGWPRTVRTALPVIGMAWMAEATGSTTGLPFGAYHYTQVLQPQLVGVPLLIPLAWLMMLPPAWAVAHAIAGVQTGWRFVIVSGLAFTAWDLFLDPQMVAWNFWQWEQPSGYYGIPWVNFAGWLLASATITAIVRPPRPPVIPLLAVYVVTWLLEGIGQLFFWNLPGPALAGFLGMGAMLLWAALTRRPAVLELNAGMH